MASTFLTEREVRIAQGRPAYQRKPKRARLTVRHCQCYDVRAREQFRSTPRPRGIGRVGEEGIGATADVESHPTRDRLGPAQIEEVLVVDSSTLTTSKTRRSGPEADPGASARTARRWVPDHCTGVRRPAGHRGSGTQLQRRETDRRGRRPRHDLPK